MAVEARKAFFAEGMKLDQEAADRKARLQAIKARKLQELAATGADEAYIKTVSRISDKPPKFAN